MYRCRDIRVGLRSLIVCRFTEQNHASGDIDFKHHGGEGGVRESVSKIISGSYHHTTHRNASAE
jgi:hypothetical protein